jgi:hypothetical protein
LHPYTGPLLIDAGFLIVFFGSGVVVLIRYALVAFVIGNFAWRILNVFPIIRHLSAWYLPSGIFAIAVVAALAIYGFRTTLEGRAVFQGLLDS